jgi:hypothetical protein
MLVEACMKYWEIIADNLKRRGWSLGWVSILDSQVRTIWIVDAHRNDGKRFVVRADEKLTAFIELESRLIGRRLARPPWVIRAAFPRIAGTCRSAFSPLRLAC